MRVALMIEGQENVTWDEWVALAQACERSGIEAMFRSDHYVSFGHPDSWGSLDAWATLAALAGHTSTLRLGTCVSPVGFRHPSMLAKAVVTVDHATGGRVELGLGAGWFDDEFHAYGFPYPEPGERHNMLEEAVEIVHRLWDADEPAVTFAGRHYRLEGCRALPRPVQDPHPPLMIGGEAGPRGVALAARWADEYNVNGVPPDIARRRRDRLSAACEAIGRDSASLSMSLMTNVLIGSDERDVVARAGRLMERDGTGGDAAAAVAARGPAVLTGTPERILEQLAVFASAGVERILLQHLLHQDLEALELIGRELVPVLASL
jgi:F420-dependent oxidoreductase-like protein